MFVEDEFIFNKCQKIIEKIFRSNVDLPFDVFRNQFDWHGFDEFDYAMSADFAKELYRLSLLSGDDQVLMMVLDPDPVAYFREKFGYYGLTVLETAELSGNYWQLINMAPKLSPADSVLFNSRKVVWIPLSGKWAIWGDRNLGLCILGSAEYFPAGEWKSVEWALQSAVIYSFRGKHVPEFFQTQLRESYSRAGT